MAFGILYAYNFTQSLGQVVKGRKITLTNFYWGRRQIGTMYSSKTLFKPHKENIQKHHKAYIMDECVISFFSFKNMFSLVQCMERPFFKRTFAHEPFVKTTQLFSKIIQHICHKEKHFHNKHNPKVQIWHIYPNEKHCHE